MSTGVACPACGAYARLEPGGTRGLTCGHLMIFRRILPKSTTGHDWRNRLRQQFLDRAFQSPGRGGSLALDLVVALETGPRRQGGDEDG